jgi:CDP-paratose 2-epimerase
VNPGEGYVSLLLITGSCGLIGAEATRHFAAKGSQVVGIDNNMRQVFFGEDGTTRPSRDRLIEELGDSYEHHDLDIRDRDGLQALFQRLEGRITGVIHTAAQPSHDWAAREPFVDFDINAVGTLNMLELTRRHCIDAPFIFTSTNKVYGDTPNVLPFVELDKRWEIASDHTYYDGIREDMTIDACLHSVFGASKVAADVMVQEYGRYFGMKTACFRGGTLTGPNHSAAELHGFLAYVMRCAMTGRHYRVFGYQGKQVRDAIHSRDLIAAFQAFVDAPRSAEVYNIGGGRHSNCSVIEAIELCEQISGRTMSWSYDEANRVGDHIWWIGDNGRFTSHYPEWSLTYDIPKILQEIFDENVDRWTT